MGYSVAVVNVGAIKSNINKIKGNLSKGVKYCAVVKSDAYGHGISKTSEAIEPLVDFFAVSFLEEGIQLRYSGIKKPVLILLPLKNSEIETASRYALSVTVDKIKQAEYISKQGYFIKVHIAVNTGMNRLGIDCVEQLKIISSLLKKNPLCEIEGIFSHFYSANKTLCLKQYKKFCKFCLEIKKTDPKVIKHICASNCVFLDKKYQLDMVRVGVAMYGYSPSSRVKTTPAMKIYAEKITDRTIKKNENVLYGEYVLQKDEKVSIIKYGYADGAFREGLCTLNNRCMDLSCVKQGKNSTVVLDNAERIARLYGTIPYEILVSFSKRSKKIYRDYEDNSG